MTLAQVRAGVIAGWVVVMGIVVVQSIVDLIISLIVGLIVLGLVGCSMLVANAVQSYEHAAPPDGGLRHPAVATAWGLATGALYAADHDTPYAGAMRLPAITTLWGLVLLPTLPLAVVFYVCYHVTVVTSAALLLWWFLPRLLQTPRPRSKVGYSLLILLVLGLTAFWGQPHVNFLLTAAIRQRVVERVVQHHLAAPEGAVVTEMSRLERVILGRATAYRDDQDSTITVYFDSYRSPLEAAFVVYAPTPDRFEFSRGTVIPLAHNWVFFRRGYAR